MSTVGQDLRYFAYGTLQKGFPNWLDLADRLGDPIGRFRTDEPYALVVPTQPGCCEAIAYCVRDPAAWLALVSSGRAELLARYERRFAGATPKACCSAKPGHAGPHDVIDPFAR
jgi:hypothetical protein